ncbi:aminotransferase class V-fold PLP-dependent enzyme [Roseiterribacter gracilis]|uniref:Cysteine desulfurase n=1 Tax=Roseiterribacter gracilis TaxID=2812848 RepID=A0A8S8XI09_9PROT|nr:cysteine desulfurase [Rhodospirillales bacterium TMPK1]
MIGPLASRKEFALDGTFLNAAYAHPLSATARAAMQRYTERRGTQIRTPDIETRSLRTEARRLFAQLIGATVGEIAFVPSTMVGENLVVGALGLPGSNAHVVTDIYHFQGSLYLYRALAERGLRVTVLGARDNRIDMEELAAAIGPDTKLVALSLVSAFSGFQHDLKRVCEIAHARGALVYADIVQAAGAIPIDVKASGVDFAACATYKWLMGDFGVGFLYVRDAHVEQLQRTLHGYMQIADFTYHQFPYDPPGDELYDVRASTDIDGHVHVGTMAHAPAVAVAASLEKILELGVDRIQQHRQPLIDRLQAELPKLGYEPLTLPGTTSPVVAFALRDAAARLQQRLDAASINIQTYPNRIRISPSVFNDMTDINRLLDVLSGNRT